VKYLKIGLIKKPHGLKGELKVLPLTDNPARYKSLKKIFLCINDNFIETEISYVKITSLDIILKLKNFNDISEVENLRNVYIFINKDEGVALNKWEYYSQDIIDCDIIYQNEKFGKVIDLINSGANDNLVILKDNIEYYYPMIRQYINNIDIERKIIEINQIEGFFD